MKLKSHITSQASILEELELITTAIRTKTSFNYDFSFLPQLIKKLLAKLRIAVIYGGDKTQQDSVIYQTHNTRSWKSYEAVARDIQTTLQDIGFQHVFLMPDDMKLAENLKKEGIHLAWLNTGGVQGYNPVCHTPAMLEMLGIPYVGHDPLNASTLDNKHVFKQELQTSEIKTAPFITWHPYPQGSLKPHLNSHFAAAFGDYQGPFVVKPVSGRASLHVYVVDSLEDLAQVADKVYSQTENTVLIEKYLAGREFCVAVGGYVTSVKGKLTKLTKPFAFSTLERVLEPDERIFTSMDKKAITSDRASLVSEEESELKRDLLHLAQRVYESFGLKSLVRIDIRADAAGVLHVLEANPKPDLKRPTNGVTSLVAMGLEEYGMSYDDLLGGLLVDRLDYLFSYNSGTIAHIVDLLT
jgi:D-alanine-D-alanine ligase